MVNNSKSTTSQYLLVTPLICFVLLLSACSSGLSGRGKTRSLGYDLSKLKNRPLPTVPPTLPFHLVVAQAGAIKPNEKLLAELRGHKKLFSKISLIPANPELREFGKEVEQRDPEGLLALAESLGGDYLFLVGGGAQSTSKSTIFSLLDLTIVGSYIVPSNKIYAKGSVLGTVLDIKNRRLVMSVQHDADLKTLSSSNTVYQNEERLMNQVLEELLINVGKKLTKKLANNAGTISTPERTPTSKKPTTKNTGKIATVYLISDGFHMGLILPYGKKNNVRQYIEIGLGERQWVMEKGWQWLNTVMAGLRLNQGIAVIETMNNSEFIDRQASQKRVWKIMLTEGEWGNMLNALETEMALQEVLVDYEKYKIVRTTKGYNLFHTCQQFALNPLGSVKSGLFNHKTKPTPVVERHLDKLFPGTSIAK